MKLINLTPHVINVITPVGVITLAPSGQVARVAVSRSLPRSLDNGVQIRHSVTGAVVGIPSPAADTLYITSVVVRQASGRDGVLSPGLLLRDAAGQPVGCDGLDSN